MQVSSQLIMINSDMTRNRYLKSNPIILRQYAKIDLNPFFNLPGLSLALVEITINRKLGH